MPKTLTLPALPEDVRGLAAGDEVLLRGRIVTGREAAHRYLATHDDPQVRRWTEGAVLYHCGPVVARAPGGGWRFVAAGPSASGRQEAWEAEVIARYGLRGVLGKGGMGPRTLEALRAHGAVYLHAAGGLAVSLARHVTRVLDVARLDALGVTEAIWLAEVEDFPAVVTMDAHGETLHARGAEAPETTPAPG
ncbi:Fe-S type hydro-lyase tartrate/fumarate beta region [Anaeromyxobacter sp. K]|uniref:fumarate hydratase C-terminal domain-containing protein n=1 Tax=Anaeromyxobacter sp. (strain K) TaxID=447217 RepID=UPI00015F9B14|nr:fumarate hydratase C-terminal domain-containing protein [Anaeromyxobacter sp. K]ACG71517.1 Fe-S type hydro-lyase tartrate/fumarate beta region [Anaeromyxobacter sp. K]